MGGEGILMSHRLNLRATMFAIKGEVVEASKEPFDVTINTDQVVVIYKSKILMREGVTLEVLDTATFNRMKQNDEYLV